MLELGTGAAPAAAGGGGSSALPAGKLYVVLSAPWEAARGAALGVLHAPFAFEARAGAEELRERLVRYATGMMECELAEAGSGGGAPSAQQYQETTSRFRVARVPAPPSAAAAVFAHVLEGQPEYDLNTGYDEDFNIPFLVGAPEGCFSGLFASAAAAGAPGVAARAEGLVQAAFQLPPSLCKHAVKECAVLAEIPPLPFPFKSFDEEGEEEEGLEDEEH